MKRLLFSIFALALLISAQPAAAHGGMLVAQVDLSSQTMTVMKSGRVLYRWKVSTGRKGYYTPTGSYRPKWLARMHYSSKYDNAPMPHSIFFRGGYAVHGTNAISRLGRPASHGCVRLHPRNAATLYALVKKTGYANSRIVIRR